MEEAHEYCRYFHGRLFVTLLVQAIDPQSEGLYHQETGEVDARIHVQFLIILGLDGAYEICQVASLC